MPAPQTQHEPAYGFQVWWKQALPRMAIAHVHSDIEMNVPLRGAPLRYLHAGRIIEVPNGRFALFWGGIPHQLLLPADGCEGVWITLPLPWVLQCHFPGGLAQRLLTGEMVVHSSADHLWRPDRWVEDFESGQSSRRKVILLEIESHLHRIGLVPTKRTSVRPCPAMAGGESRLVEITRHLAAHYNNDLAVGDVAAALGLNARYMMRLFQQHAGMTVWEYVLRLRVAHAQRLLITTPWKVADIALESGFGSAAAFYAAFQKLGGQETPGEFRRKNSAPNRRSVSQQKM